MYSQGRSDRMLVQDLLETSHEPCLHIAKSQGHRILGSLEPLHCPLPKRQRRGATAIASVDTVAAAYVVVLQAVGSIA